MNLLHNLAVKLGITKAEMTAVTLLTFFLLLGGALKYNGAVQQTDRAISRAKTASFAEADVDSLLTLALQEKQADEAGATPAAAPTGQFIASNTQKATPAPKAAPKHIREKKLIGTISFNTASATQLQRISGIGPVMARRLIEFRQRKGGKVLHFNDFLKVKGIGKKKLERLKQHLTLD